MRVNAYRKWVQSLSVFPLSPMFSFVVISAASEAASSVDWGNLVVTSPIAAVLGWLLWDERKDRRAIEAQYIEFMRTSIPILEKATSTIHDVVTTVKDLSKESRSRGRDE